MTASMPAGGARVVQACSSAAPRGFHSNALGQAGSRAIPVTLRVAIRRGRLVSAGWASQVMASVHHGGRPRQPLMEELLIGLDLECIGNDPVRIGQHAVVRDDGITFNAVWNAQGVNL